MFCSLVLISVVLFALWPAISQAIDHPTSNPYETRPDSDASLNYQIIPIPDGLVIEKDVMVTMPDGVKLACNVFRPDKPGKFPIIMSMTPYGKDQTPPPLLNLMALWFRTHITLMSSGFIRTALILAI
jgi:predicted acyl esterase